MRALLALLTLTAALPGQQPKDGKIAFAVQDSAGNPIGGALILLRGSTTGEVSKEVMRHGVSDAGGVLRFENLANGYYRVESHAAGRQLDPSDEVQIQIEGPKASVSRGLRLLRRPVVTGRVINELGVPVFNAQVELLRRSTNEGKATVVSQGQASTDDRGVFRIAVQEPGRYWVKASATEASFPRGSAPLPTGVVLHPGSPDLLGALPLDLRWDQPEVRIDLALPRAPRTNLIVAIVSGPDQRPCTRCRYSLERVEGPYSYPIVGGNTSNRPGFDYRGIPVGDYRIYVEDYDRHRGWWAVAEAGLAEGGATEVLVATRPPVMLAGRVVLEEPPAKVLEQNREREDAVSISVNGVGRTFFSGGPEAIQHLTLSLDDLRFQLGPEPPERFQLQVYVQHGNAYVAGVRRQGRALESSMLDLAEPGPWTDLEVRVRFDPANLQIRVPVENALDPATQVAWVALTPDPQTNPFGKPAESMCSPDGGCRLPPSPPGRYWAIAVAGAKPPGSLDLRDPEVRTKLKAWGRQLDLQPGENPAVELQPVPAKQLAGLGG